MRKPGLGRRALPTGDDKHLRKYALAEPTTAFEAERLLSLPNYRKQYDQGSSNACVGYSSSWAMSILNRQLYDPKWLWEEAKNIDEWPDTNAGDGNGTSVRAGMDVLRTEGHRQVRCHYDKPVSMDHGILKNEWATTVDQVRASLENGIPVVLGVDWFDEFFTPEKIGHDYWIGRELAGTVAGGHAICAYGVSDKKQAIKLVNSWGAAWPLVWLPYDTLQKLLDGYETPGEATVITDRKER